LSGLAARPLNGGEADIARNGSTNAHLWGTRPSNPPPLRSLVSSKQVYMIYVTEDLPH